MKQLMIAAIILLMKAIADYFQRHSQRIEEIYQNSCKEGAIPATNLFLFLREVFSLGELRVQWGQREYFAQDEHQSHTEQIIGQYYKTTPNGKSGKFYLYRISFDLEEIKQYLAYWIKNDPTIQFIDTHEQLQPQSTHILPEKGLLQTQRNTLGQSTLLKDNQFITHPKDLDLRQNYMAEIKKLEEAQLMRECDESERKRIAEQIDSFRGKVQRMRSEQSKRGGKSSLPKLKTEVSKARQQEELRTVFEFYARQNHLTGVKASFERIQHESQTMNYQKLVHFLKEYCIFPSTPASQKKLHSLYIRACSQTRDLHFQQFKHLLDQLPPLLDAGGKEKLLSGIRLKDRKNALHNPFHSPQKQDFRIDSQNIKYSFRLHPLKGKLENEVDQELSSRRMEKEISRVELSREKQEQREKQLRRLKAVDPYHPLVLKHATLLDKSQSTPPLEAVASLENMESFRDANFDMKAHFGIADAEEDPLKPAYRYNDRAAQLQKQQSQRMEVLMSGLLERSQARLQKFSQSPRKRQVSSKLY